MADILPLSLLGVLVVTLGRGVGWKTYALVEVVPETVGVGVESPVDRSAIVQCHPVAARRVRFRLGFTRY